MCEKPRDGDADDAALLAQAARGSREALAAVARRYVAFVYNTAVRHVRDPHLAEDVAQAVFVILARKVHRIKPGTLLHAWLFATTRYAAKNALRMQARRAHHESKAAAAAKTRGADKTVPVPVFIEAMLDDAMAELGETDRSAVLLCYFGEKNWREVGARIGSAEDAARMHVGRAVAQMRAFFARRGMHVSAATVAAGLASAARASAPHGLVEAVACSMTAPALSGAAAEGVISMMIWTQVKMAAAFAAGLLLTIGLAGAMVMHRAQDKPAAAATTAPAPVPNRAGAVTLEGGVTVELLEVTGLHGAKSWRGDGTPA